MGWRTLSTTCCTGVGDGDVARERVQGKKDWIRHEGARGMVLQIGRPYATALTVVAQWDKAACPSPWIDKSFSLMLCWASSTPSEILSTSFPLPTEMTEARRRCLDPNPATRLTARGALEHPFFAAPGE